MLRLVSTKMQYVLIIFNLIVLSSNGVRWKSIKKNVPKMFLNSRANCNPHNYSLMLNSPALCDKENVSLLVLVRSIPANSGRRQIIRRTWGSLKEVKGKRVKVAFLFAKSSAASNGVIKSEHDFYKDIIQESFPEMYHNLHLKTVMGWKWSLTYCPEAAFVIICNDELFIDIFKTVIYINTLIETKQHEEFYGCYMEREANPPNRNLNHKHGISWKDYPGKHYAAFCNANGYIMSQKITRKMYEMSLNTPSFMPDDVWTGILSAKLGLVISNIQNRINIKPNHRLIKQYDSVDPYAEINVIFFPLDRLYTKCEVCVADYLWPRIMRYNKPSTFIKTPPNCNFYSKYYIVFLISFIFSIVIFIRHYLLIMRRKASLIITAIIFILIMLFELFHEFFFQLRP